MLGMLGRITKILLIGMPYEKPVFIIVLSLGPKRLMKYISLASRKAGYGEYILKKGIILWGMSRWDSRLSMCLLAGQLAMSGCRTCCLCTLFLFLKALLICPTFIHYIPYRLIHTVHFLYCMSYQIYSCPMKEKTIASLKKFTTATSFIATFVDLTFVYVYKLNNYIQDR